MKNKTKTFGIDFGVVGNGDAYTLHMPFSVYPEFQRAASNPKEGEMETLVGIFSCFAEMDDVKRMTTQTMIIERAESLKTLEDVLILLKTLKACMEFFDLN